MNLELYTARYHSEPDTIAAYGFDAMKLLEQAMQNGGGSDPAKIRDSLEHIRGFVGLSGVYNLSASDHQGLALSDLVIAQVRNGTWQLAGGK